MLKYSLFVLSVVVSGRVALGVPAPNSKYCTGAKGHVLFVEDEKGAQASLCRFDDSSVINPATIADFIETKNSPDAVTEFLKVDYNERKGKKEKWAVDYCEQTKGKIVSYSEVHRPTSRYDLCVFGDRSSIDAWTLFMGPRYADTLKKVLTKK